MDFDMLLRIMVKYNVYVIFFWLLLLSLLLLLAIARQQQIKKLTKIVTANFENIRAKVDELSGGQKGVLAKQATDLAKALKEMSTQVQTIASAASGSGKKMEAIGENLGGKVNELLSALSSGSIGGGGGMDPSLIAEIGTRLEELSDELAWSHHYYDELKTLEKAVHGMVGPEKMRQLIEKEKAKGSTVL